MVKEAKDYKLVDIQSIDINEPSDAIKSFTVQEPDQIVKCDVLIVGGGLGAVACALSLTRERQLDNHKGTNQRRLKVCLIEETNWLGGQATSQGVSALDENYLVETSGASMHYKNFRTMIRDYYKSRYSTVNGTNNGYFNPGNCWVSRLAFEPKVGLFAIDTMLDSAVSSEKLRIFHRTKTVSVEKTELATGKVKIQRLTAVNLDTEESIQFRPKMVIDATEFGDMLPLCDIKYKFGQESKEETDEPHAPDEGNSDAVQDYVYPFVVELCPGEDNTIQEPPGYQELKDKGQFSFLGYKMFESYKDENSQKEYLPFWTYRRLIDKQVFQDLAYKNDIAMINWESNDVSGRNIIDKSNETIVDNLAEAKKISLGFLYWLQTEAPRENGEKGYKELKLRTDILQTEDGLSKYPYIRESRRIDPYRLVLETDIGSEFNSGARAKFFPDSIGIGLYPIDIHGPKLPGAAQETKPFQVPMGSLIPKDAENLLPACKNIGVSHLANGAYRLHPIEWAIGAASGLIASKAVLANTAPEKLLKKTESLFEIQEALVHEGEPIYWYDDVSPEHFCFPQIQMLSMTGVMPGETDSLHFYPDKPISRQMIAKIISLVVNKTKFAPNLIADVPDNHPFSDYVNQMIQLNLMHLDANYKFRPANPITVTELNEIAQSRYLKIPAKNMLHVSVLTDPEVSQNAMVTRAQFAEWIYAVITYKKKWISILSKQAQFNY